MRMTPFEHANHVQIRTILHAETVIHVNAVAKTATIRFVALLFVRFPMAVRYTNKCCVTSHDTSAGLLGTFQASNIDD